MAPHPSRLRHQLRRPSWRSRAPASPGASGSTSFSRNLRFDEAFAAALDSLPPVEPPFPDALTRIRVLEVGGLFGGFPGFHDLFVRICRTVGG
jgi:hypothetical protein